MIAAEYNTTIKSWYPDYEQLLNKVIEDIKIKLSKANGDSINFQLEAKEEQRILPGELLFYVSSAAEDPHCFFLFKILEIDLTERGFFGMNSAWQQSADGQRWRGSLSFRVKKLLEPF